MDVLGIKIMEFYFSIVFKIKRLYQKNNHPKNSHA
jgi:hypothetical protein